MKFEVTDPSPLLRRVNSRGEYRQERKLQADRIANTTTRVSANKELRIVANHANRDTTYL
jgi:hypothetical protein